jgi:hypothetical protein
MVGADAGEESVNSAIGPAGAIVNTAAGRACAARAHATDSAAAGVGSRPTRCEPLGTRARSCHARDGRAASSRTKATARGVGSAPHPSRFAPRHHSRDDPRAVSSSRSLLIEGLSRCREPTTWPCGSESLSGGHVLLPIWHEVTKLARSTATQMVEEIATEIAHVIRGRNE